MLMLWSAYGDQWSNNHKVNFDGVNKLITISPYVSTIDVKVDLYSAMKEWLQLYDNAKFLPAIRTIGGDPVGLGKYAGDIYFLINGWQVVIDHYIEIQGTLYNDSGASPYIIQPGGGVVATVSNLAYSIESATGGLTPEQEIQLDKILKAVKTAIALSA
jgi:hypothetical protein